MFVKTLTNKISPWGISEKRILRYAIGSTFALSIAMAFAWPLSYLVPVLLLGFFKPGSAAPTIKSSLNFILIIAFACLLGVLISQYFIPYPLLHIPIMALLLMHLFYAKKSVLNPDLKTWIMIATLMIPIMGLSAQELAFTVAINIMMGAVIMVLLNLFIYVVFPEPHKKNTIETTPSPLKETSASSRLSEAKSGLIVVMPILSLFYLFNWSNHALVLIFVAILGSMPAISKSFNLGKAMIIGNLFGGITAIIMFEFLVMVPHYYFLICIVLLAAFYFGMGLFSQKKSAPLFGMAFSTVLVIIGSATSGTSDAGDKVWLRVIQISVAVIYVVLAYRFVDKWTESSTSNLEY